MKNKVIQERFETLYNQLLINDKLPFAASILERAARLWPQRTALYEENISITFKELYDQSCQISLFLHNKGVQAGDRVVIIWENSINFYKAYYGAWQTGAIATPVNTFLHPKELSYILNHAQPRVILISTALKEKFIIEDQKILTFTENELFSSVSSQNDFSIPERDSHEPAILLYTSGTTGFPKGVMLSSQNILINCLQGIACFSITEQERLYAALPLFHSYMQNTCVWSPFLVGAATIIVPKIERRALLHALEKKPTIILGIPALYGLFCLMKTAPFKYVKYFVCGGDALSDKTRYYFSLLYRRKICNGYGLTETSPFLAVNLCDEQASTSKVGHSLYGIEIAIRDEQSSELADGQVGNVWVKGENIMRGYYKDPQRTAQVIQDEWFNTADLGYKDEDGALILAGRESDLIKHKGMKIYPQEIENVLMLHPHLMQVAVIGVQEENEEIPIAFIGLSQENSTIIQELEALCKHHIASYKIPRRFIIRDQLPTTATGKVDKKLLKREYHEKNADYSLDFQS
jgi:long-chain acyl-CoA synthetase